MDKSDNYTLNDKIDSCTQMDESDTCIKIGKSEIYLQMDESGIHRRVGSLVSSEKKHFLAWDKEYSHLKWGGPASIRNLQAYLPSKSRVLDAGSGNGRYLGELARNYMAIGADISLIALYSSRDRFARRDMFAEHIGASVLNLPFKSQSFDGILCYGVLQHLFREERESTVMELKRVLKEGGFIFFEAFGSEDMRCGGEFSTPYENSTFVRQNGIIYHYFTKEEVRTLFNGFEIIKLEDVIKEKVFRGEAYKRQMIKAVFRKS